MTHPDVKPRGVAVVQAEVAREVDLIVAAIRRQMARRGFATVADLLADPELGIREVHFAIALGEAHRREVITERGGRLYAVEAP